MRNPKPDQSIETAMEWIELSVTPSLEKIRLAVGDDIYYQCLSSQMEEVELRKCAIDQINTYCHVHGAPESEVPF